MDVNSAKAAVQFMKNMRHATVICTIHQPSSDIFKMFDKLLILAEGGQVAYFGPLGGAASFFKTHGIECPLTFNPADVFVRSLAVVPFKEEESRERILKICQEYREKFEESVLHENG